VTQRLTGFDEDEELAGLIEWYKRLAAKEDGLR
jgi:hypothetical protein